MISKDYTSQEKLVAEILSEFGIRYEQQKEIERFTVDFFISDGRIVLEADGKYGHFKKADKKRDDDLMISGEVADIFHIKSNTKSGIMQEIKEFFGWNAEEEIL